MPGTAAYLALIAHNRAHTSIPTHMTHTGTRRHEPRLDLDTFKQLVVALTENDEGVRLLDCSVTHGDARRSDQTRPVARAVD